MEPIGQIGIYIPLLPALFSAVVWRRLSTTQRWLGVMLWVVALNSVAGRLWVYMGLFPNPDGLSNNLPLFHAYILIESLALIQVFRLELGRSLHPLVAVGLSIAFPIGWMINVIWVDGIWGYPTYIHALEAVIIVALSVTWFLKMLREKIIRDPVRTFGFWLSTGLLIYFSANLLLFAFSNFIVAQNDGVFFAIWEVHAILAILLYLIYTLAILWAAKTPISS